MICILEVCSHWLLQLISRIKLRHVCILFATIWILDLFGAFTHVFELTYEKHFKYPYDGDIQSFVDAIKHKKKPVLDPINDYNYTYIHDGREYCVDNDFKTLRVVFLIKSSAPNFERRSAIRSTWGYKKRFFDVPTRTIFLLGVHENDYSLQEQINDEAEVNNDILQANFIDSYYNNTIKTMMGFKWAYYHCRNAKFYMFVDDDMYVSVKNVLRFIRNPAYYPEYLKDPSRLVKRDLNDKVNTEVTRLVWNNVSRIHQNEHEPFPQVDPDGRTIKNAHSDTVARWTSKVKRTTERENSFMRRREGWETTRMSLKTFQPNNRSQEIANVVNNEVTSSSTRVEWTTTREKILMRPQKGWREDDERKISLTEDKAMNNPLNNKFKEKIKVMAVNNKVKARTPLTESETTESILHDIVKQNVIAKGRVIDDKVTKEIPFMEDKAMKNVLNHLIKVKDKDEAVNSKVKTEKTLTEAETIKNDLNHIVKRQGKENKVMTLRDSVRIRIPLTKEDLDHERSETFFEDKPTGFRKPFSALNDYAKLTRGRRHVFDLELPDDVRLFAGYVFVSSPHRHKTSKWYVSLAEYPYHLWPPYVTAGAYVLSKVALVDMYLTSLYTKHFRFDDIYLGIVAKKADIEPFHCDEFHFYKRDYTRFNYKYVIASHGYGNPEELMTIWNEQKAMGNT